MGAYRVRRDITLNPLRVGRAADLVLDDENLIRWMRRRSPNSGSALDRQQDELARRENELRDQMRKLQRMIEEAPRVAEEASRRQREELLHRANQSGSRLDASVALRDRRWGDEETNNGRRRSLRKERREGRLIFVVLVIALLATVMWLVTRFHF